MRYMVDQNLPPSDAAPVAQTPVAETVTVVTPVAETTVNTPVTEVVDNTVLGVEPVVETVVETPPEEKTSDTPKETSDAKADEAKPEIKEGDKAEVSDTVSEDKPAETKTDNAALPTYEAFVLPEGITVDEARIGEFTSMLGSFESISKAPHEEVQKFGQALLDYHVSRVQDTVTDLTKAYNQMWEKQKNEWRDQFEKDPEIGGNRKDTTVAAANNFIRTHGGTDEQQKEFRQVLEKTGLGNHPAIIRILANAGISKNHTEGSPLPAQAPAPTKMGKIEKMYGSKGGKR